MSKKLNLLRKKIDRADHALLKAFGARFKAIKEVGILKKKLKMPIVQHARWHHVVKDRLKKAKKLKLSPSFTKAVYKLIHDEAIRIQKRK